MKKIKAENIFPSQFTLILQALLEGKKVREKIVEGFIFSLHRSLIIFQIISLLRQYLEKHLGQLKLNDYGLQSHLH